MRVMIAVIAMLLAGCAKEEVAPTEPIPEYLSVSQVSFTCYGDDMVFKIKDDEAVQNYSSTQIILLPDKTAFDTIRVDYVQGVSLNDYGKAYYTGLEESDKSDYNNGVFTAGEYCYVFGKTESNNYVMIRGSIDYEDYCVELMKRFLG